MEAGGSPLLFRSSGSAPRGPLTSCGAAGPPGAVLEGPCPGRWAQPRVGMRGENGAAGEWRQKVKRGGRGREGGKKSRATTFLSPIAWGGEPQGADQSLPESEAELLRGWTGRPFKAAVGAGAWTERSLPPPPGVPALLSPSLRQTRSARTVPVGSDQAAAASSTGRRTGGSSWHHRCQLPSRGRRGAGEAAGAQDWSRRLEAPLLRGGCAAPRRAAPPRAASRPRPPPAASALRCSVSEFAGVSVPGFRSRQAERQRLGRSKPQGPCLRAEVLHESPLDPGRGAYAGWGPPWTSKLRSSGAQNGRAGAALGGPRTPLLAGGGGGSAWGVPRVSAPLSVSASRPAPGEAATSFAFQQSISAITFAPISGARSLGPGRGSLLRWSWVLAAEAPATNPHFATSGVPRAGLASESGDSALGAAPRPPNA